MITIRRRIFARRLSTVANPELRFDKQTAGTSDEFHVNIGNYQIHFPYVPYACQREYMEKVLFSLESGTNAALESPTGTGKTLSLLCPTIEWFLQQKKSAKLQGIPSPKIYYSSRTHHQLKQVIKELNKTKYRNMVKVTTLASRDHLCLNQHVLRAANKGEMCQTKIREKMCQFYRNFQEISRNKDKFENVYFADNLDLNGVKELARQNGHCPFYAAREMSKSADLIFLPYNYLLEPEIREHFSIDLKGNILIFDEAHNLESIAEKSMSISFSTGILRKAINELWEAIKLKEKLLNRNIDGGLGNLKEDRQLYKRLNELERQIKCMDLERDGVGMHAISGLNRMDGRVFEADKMVELLRAAGIEYEDRHKIRALINHICAFLAVQIERSRRWEYKGGFKIPIPRGIGLTHFNLLLSRIFIDMENTKAPSLNDHFKLFAHERWTGENEKEIMLHLWCFDAGVAMRYLVSRGTRSIILASGTLAPLGTFLATMGIHFGAIFESAHCARRDNLVVGIVTKGPNNARLLGTFENRNTTNYKQAIGELLLQLVRVTPQGMLVFFPSYGQMSNFIDHWKGAKTGGGRQLWDELNRQKRIFAEPKDKTDIPALFRDFDAAVRTTGGAILLAICRGKLSEGIDFADSHCRSVVIVGIPYPPYFDAKVLLKKAHLMEQCRRRRMGNTIHGGKLRGPNEWYKNEATRAVNQALGRVIRHKEDFGTVILADTRFAEMNRRAFPSWIRCSIQTYPSSNSILPSIQRFFLQKGKMMNRR